MKVFENVSRIDRESKFIEGLLNHGGLVMEPWFVRNADISSTTDILKDGSIGDIQIQEQRVNSFGAFYGVFRNGNREQVNRWEEHIQHMTKTLAAEVAEQGYFGPVGFDSFIYCDRNGSEKCTTGIEINARFTVGRIAEAARKKIAADRSVLLRFLGRKKCMLPTAYNQWYDLMGPYAFNPETRCGIVILTPLTAGYQGTWEQPQKNVFLIAGISQRQITEYDEILRCRVARKGRGKNRQ
jgi:hypothetical protein